VIRLGDEQYWLYAAVDPESNELLHTKLEPNQDFIQTKVIASTFFKRITPYKAEFFSTFFTDVRNTTSMTPCFRRWR